MRDYKFRVWLPQINTMMYDKDINNNNRIKELAKLSNYEYPFEGDEWYPWNSVFTWLCLDTNPKRMIPMQYTGLKDINGTKIYEGDIIPHHFNENIKGIIKFGEYKSPCDDKFTKHQGFYIDFYGESKDYYRKDLGYWASLSKVIGNVYETPNLLNR